MSSIHPERVYVLGQPIDCVTMAQTVGILEKFLVVPGTKLVLTADSNAFINAETDESYARIFREAALITPDSSGPVWAMNKLGHSVPSRVSGVDLVEELCKISVKTGASLYFLGAAPGVAESAAKNLENKYPGMKISGYRDGFFSPSEDQVVAAEISKTNPDVLLVAMGMPRQELFILDTASVIGAKLGIGVGGSFDVHSGSVQRAPSIIQKLRLEWLWRFILNPRKISKVKNLPIFWWRIQFSKRRPTK
jgi:N-acetylglucosaminyldiphosphoundecaprenol N-acetyl-beta-D-mannosaminyltransferase